MYTNTRINVDIGEPYYLGTGDFFATALAQLCKDKEWMTQRRLTLREGADVIKDVFSIYRELYKHGKLNKTGSPARRIVSRRLEVQLQVLTDNKRSDVLAP
jgi:hypothetical protein